MGEDRWPLFREKGLPVSGVSTLSLPWQVVALAAVLAQASELSVEEEESEVWGLGGPGCLVGKGAREASAGPGLVVRWGATPGLLGDGTFPLWLAWRGESVSVDGRSWLVRDCSPQLTVRTVPQTAPPGLSAALMAVNRNG